LIRETTGPAGKLTLRSRLRYFVPQRTDPAITLINTGGSSLVADCFWPSDGHWLTIPSTGKNLENLMNTSNSLKCAAVLLPVLALGMPMAIASDPPNELADQRTVASERSKMHQTAHQGYLETLPARGYHSDSIIGKEVMNRRNNEIVGEVSNLVLDEDGQVVAVIISLGGLMGIGDRDLAIEWDQIERKVVGDDITLSVELTEASLKDAPKYSRERSDRSTSMIDSDREQQRTGQATDRRVSQTTDPRTSQTTDPRTSQTTNPRASQTAEQRTAQTTDPRATASRTAEYVEAMPARGYHSDSLVGQEVKSRLNNKSIGTVSDLVIDNDGQVVALIIGVGGLMGLGQRDVAIAWDQIERSFDDDETTLWVNLTEQSLKDAPKYSSERKTTRR
jgi:sporulation protein YlmC with PRC-barrel domain